MKVSILLLLCIQVLCSRAGPSRRAEEPTLTSVACNDPQAEAAADLSLRQLNANQRQGFALGLERITNVQEQFDEENGSVFYLTLDVFETECHVLSRRLWKECNPKPPHEAVSGECKVIIQLNKPQRIAHLHNYDCTLSPDTSGLVRGCAGCHFSQPLNDTDFLEVARKSLEKYNKESSHNKIFVLGNITKAASQVVSGRAYHVEYTIHESSCNKSAEDQSICGPLDCEFAHTGYCKSMAVAHWSSPDDKSVTNVLCDIFEPEAAIVEEQKHASGHTEDKRNNDKKHHHGKKGDRGRGKKHGHKHGHGHDKHDHKHNHKHDHDHSESHEHEHDHEHLHNYEHHHAPGRGEGSQPASPKTTGTVTFIAQDETSAATGSEDKKEKGKKPPKRGPLLLGQGKPSKSFIKPFPEKASASEQCPGLSKRLTVDIPSIAAPQDPTTIPK